MQTLKMLSFLSLLPGIALAQDFTGTYTLPTSNGAITLNLNQNTQGQVVGSLVGDDGLTFQVAGQVEEGFVQGSIANQNGGAGFGAAFNGDQLFVYLIPLDGNNQPDEANAQQFLMQRQQTTSVLPISNSPQPGPVGNTNQWEGAYSGSINGTPTTLTLHQQGTTLQGEANANGYRYTLSGTANGSAAQGTLTDPQNGATMPFEMAMQGQALTLNLISQDPYSGQSQRIAFNFQRQPAGQSGGPISGGAVHGDVRGGATDNYERDSRLIGAWSHSDTMISGNYSAVTQVFMQVNPDGTYAYGNGRVMAGGSNAYGSVSGDTGYGDDVSRGKWRTQNSIIYIMEPGYNQWIPYACYYVEGGKMMLTFENGSKEIWYRR